LSDNFLEAELEHCDHLIAEAPHALSSLIRGHFMTNGVLNWIKKQLPKNNQSISLDHLYTATVDACQSCAKAQCPQVIAMSGAIKEAFRKATEANKNMELTW
jgi:hypothetical protein